MKRRKKDKQPQQSSAPESAPAPGKSSQEPWPEDEALGNSAAGAALGGAVGGGAGAAAGALAGLLGSGKSKKNSYY